MRAMLWVRFIGTRPTVAVGPPLPLKPRFALRALLHRWPVAPPNCRPRAWPVIRFSRVLCAWLRLSTATAFRSWSRRGSEPPTSGFGPAAPVGRGGSRRGRRSTGAATVGSRSGGAVGRSRPTRYWRNQCTGTCSGGRRTRRTLGAEPFGTADGIVARAASRLVAVSSGGLDPHNLGVPRGQLASAATGVHGRRGRIRFGKSGGRRQLGDSVLWCSRSRCARGDFDCRRRYRIVRQIAPCRNITNGRRCR